MTLIRDLKVYLAHNLFKKQKNQTPLVGECEVFDFFFLFKFTYSTLFYFFILTIMKNTLQTLLEENS